MGISYHLKLIYIILNISYFCLSTSAKMTKWIQIPSYLILDTGYTDRILNDPVRLQNIIDECNQTDVELMIITPDRRFRKIR